MRYDQQDVPSVVVNDINKRKKKKFLFVDRLEMGKVGPGTKFISIGTGTEMFFHWDRHQNFFVNGTGI